MAATPLPVHFPLIEHCQQLSQVYLDSAATSQKPQQVIDAISAYYQRDNANVHRAAYSLAIQATTDFEQGRLACAKFINAERPEEIIFTAGTTEAFNLLANTLPYCGDGWQPGDEIILSQLEHHANIVPWQMVANKLKLVIKVVDIDVQGDLCLDHLQQLLTDRTRLVSISHVSNTLGTINPIKKICQLAHANGSLVAVDGAQAVAHAEIDVAALACDFYCFSGHKMYGPTGVGVLWGRYRLLDLLPPWQGGGEMIETVSFGHTRYKQLPFRLEAGTPNISGVIGLARAIAFITHHDRAVISAHEQRLLMRAKAQAAAIPGVRIIGQPQQQTSLFSFVVDDCHPSDIATLLDEQGIFVRSGHHCCQPLMQALGLEGTVRVSFAVYNSEHDVDRFISALTRACDLL
jgi:SufS family cysteine desulfurase